jgi:hypothetical protein
MLVVTSSPSEQCRAVRAAPTGNALAT